MLKGWKYMKGEKEMQSNYLAKASWWDDVWAFGNSLTSWKTAFLCGYSEIQGQMGEMPAVAETNQRLNKSLNTQ